MSLLSRRMAGVTLATLLATGASAMAADTIKIGIPVGLSGANSVVAPSVVQ
jgi:urea transport system substrate-binding protein